MIKDPLMGMSTMTERGQVTIPKTIREHEGFKAGRKFVMKDIDGAIMIIPAR